MPRDCLALLQQAYLSTLNSLSSSFPERFTSTEIYVHCLSETNYLLWTENHFQSKPQIQHPFIKYFSKAAATEAFIIYKACIHWERTIHFSPGVQLSFFSHFLKISFHI